MERSFIKQGVIDQKKELVQKGQRIGMIKRGLQVDLILPEKVRKIPLRIVVKRMSMFMLDPLL